MTATTNIQQTPQVIIWLQLVADAPVPSSVGGEISRELAHDGESQSLLLQGGNPGGDDSGYDVAREIDVLEAAVVNGRRAQVQARGYC